MRGISFSGTQPTGFQQLQQMRIAAASTDAKAITPVSQQTTPTKPYILVFDHGTTGIRACLMNSKGEFVARGYNKFKQIYPKAGWVEHDAKTLWKTSLKVVDEAFKAANASWNDVAAVAITNQRETAVLWDTKTGKPIHNAIVWQCRRTSDVCDTMKQQQPALENEIRDKTGLLLDPYFSATKIKWMLDNVPEAKKLLDQGRLRFGTVDTWILWNLSGGKVHVTDPTNASRTLLYNIHTKDWDEDLLKTFGIPKELLPKVQQSNTIYGETDPKHTGGIAVPLAGNAGDQQAALYGQRCWQPGSAKSTYGTGAFLVMNLGDQPVTSKKGLLTTLAANRYGNPSFALEGAIFMAGAVIEWLQKGLGIIKSPKEVDKLATSVESTDGVYLVPAFVGLGAPYWDSHARGGLSGITQGTGKAHIARAAIESIAYQTKEVLDAMQTESGIKLENLRVDGGVTKSNFLMQFLADILGIPVLRSEDAELTAKGAGYLAGLATGFWKSPEEIAALPEKLEKFEPKMDDTKRQSLYQGWLVAVKKVLTQKQAVQV